MFNEDEFGNPKSSFKYILDHTFYRPRDFILFFKDISQKKFKIPLGFQEVNKMIGDYSYLIIDEIKNELTCKYTGDEINKILQGFKEIARHESDSLNFEEISEIYNEKGFKESLEEVLDDLYSYSYLFQIDSNNKRYIKFREKIEPDSKFLSKERNFILHPAIKVYFRNNNVI
jgi:uncharacterized protein YihD (DUF1040 family)